MSRNYTYITTIIGSTGKEYDISMRDDGLLTCPCPSWVFNQRKDRTCKHIDQLRTRAMIDKIGMIGKVGELPKICNQYPEKCDGCKIRFQCHTSSDVFVTGRDDR